MITGISRRAAHPFAGDHGIPIGLPDRHGAAVHLANERCPAAVLDQQIRVTAPVEVATGASYSQSGAGQLEHRALVAWPTEGCSAEEVPGGVGDQRTGPRTIPVLAIEADQVDRCSGVAAGLLDDFEHVAKALRPA